MLQGLSAFCGKNVPGATLIEYAPVAWVDQSTYRRLISTAWNWQVDIDFTTSGWLTMPVLPVGRLWEEQERRSDQGRFFEQEVRGVLPAMRPAVSGELDEMSEHRFLIRLTDRQGQKWLLGTLDNPFDFQAGAGTGDHAGGLNSYRMAFTAQTQRRAYGFVPVL